MAPNTYQTYTEDTPIDIYRSDFIWRGAMCAASVKRYPALADTAATANETVTKIDARRAALQEAEDNQIRARAIENVEKLDVADVYLELRRTASAKSYDVLTLLPDAPSALRRTTVATFAERADLAVANLQALPDGDPLKDAFLAKLVQELDEFKKADKDEDATRAAVRSQGMAMILYKAELSQAREAELGTILKVVRDREKSAMFTLPWRKPSRGKPDADPAAEPEAPPPVT